MGDAMKKVRTGDPLVVPAQAYNAFIDAAKDFHRRTANLGQQATPGYRSAGIVLVSGHGGSYAGGAREITYDCGRRDGL